MQSIKDFLQRFKNFTPPERVVRRAVVEVVKNECGIALADKEVMVQDSVVYIRTSPAVRSEIILNKARLLATLAKDSTLNNRRISDIR